MTNTPKTGKTDRPKGPTMTDQTNTPHTDQPKSKRFTRKRIAIGAAAVIGLGAIGTAIGANDSSGDQTKTETAAHVEDHATYEVEQQRTKPQAPTSTTTAPPKPTRTYDAHPEIPADVIDDLFVKTLRDQGIKAPRDVMVEAGRDGVCVLAPEVSGFGDLAIIVAGATGFEAGDAGTLIGASIAAYCPDFEYLVSNAQDMGA